MHRRNRKPMYSENFFRKPQKGFVPPCRFQKNSRGPPHSGIFAYEKSNKMRGAPSCCFNQRCLNQRDEINFVKVTKTDLAVKDGYKGKNKPGKPPEKGANQKRPRTCWNEKWTRGRANRQNFENFYASHKMRPAIGSVRNPKECYCCQCRRKSFDNDGPNGMKRCICYSKRVNGPNRPRRPYEEPRKPRFHAANLMDENNSDSSGINMSEQDLKWASRPPKSKSQRREKLRLNGNNRRNIPYDCIKFLPISEMCKGNEGNSNAFKGKKSSIKKDGCECLPSFRCNYDPCDITLLKRKLDEVLCEIRRYSTNVESPVNKTEEYSCFQEPCFDIIDECQERCLKLECQVKVLFNDLLNIETHCIDSDTGDSDLFRKWSLEPYPGGQAFDLHHLPEKEGSLPDWFDTIGGVPETFEEDIENASVLSALPEYDSWGQMVSAEHTPSYEEVRQERDTYEYVGRGDKDFSRRAKDIGRGDKYVSREDKYGGRRRSMGPEDSREQMISEEHTPSYDEVRQERDKYVGRGVKDIRKGDKDIGRGDKYVAREDKYGGRRPSTDPEDSRGQMISEDHTPSYDEERQERDKYVGKGDKDIGKGNKDIGRGDKYVARGSKDIGKGDKYIGKKVKPVGRGGPMGPADNYRSAKENDKPRHQGFQTNKTVAPRGVVSEGEMQKNDKGRQSRKRSGNGRFAVSPRKRASQDKEKVHEIHKGGQIKKSKDRESKTIDDQDLETTENIGVPRSSSPTAADDDSGSGQVGGNCYHMRCFPSHQVLNNPKFLKCKGYQQRVDNYWLNRDFRRKYNTKRYYV